MRRLTAAFLVASFVGIGAGSSATAQSPTPETGTDAGPVVHGGRIEVPSSGFAMTWPEDWYAFDLTHPDLLTAAEALDEYAAFMAAEALTFPAAAFAGVAETDDHEAALMAMKLDLVEPLRLDFCSVIRFGIPQLRDADIDSFIREVKRHSEGLGWDHIGEPETVELPVGEATVLWGTAGPDYAGSFEAYADYFVTREEDAFLFACAGEDPPADRWLSIAETFEFVPAEE